MLLISVNLLLSNCATPTKPAHTFTSRCSVFNEVAKECVMVEMPWSDFVLLDDAYNLYYEIETGDIAP